MSCVAQICQVPPAEDAQASWTVVFSPIIWKRLNFPPTSWQICSLTAGNKQLPTMIGCTLQTSVDKSMHLAQSSIQSSLVGDLVNILQRSIWVLIAIEVEMSVVTHLRKNLPEQVWIGRMTAVPLLVNTALVVGVAPLVTMREKRRRKRDMVSCAVHKINGKHCCAVAHNVL